MSKKLHFFVIILFSIFTVVLLACSIFLFYRVTNLATLPDYYNEALYLYVFCFAIFISSAFIVSLIVLIILIVLYVVRKRKKW